jgi:hypothetical protein
MRDTGAVLAVNLLLQRSGQRSFDESVTAAARRLGLDCTILYPDVLGSARIEDYSRIVLSGSEASILEKQSWDENLHTVVDAAAERGRRRINQQLTATITRVIMFESPSQPAYGSAS